MKIVSGVAFGRKVLHILQPQGGCNSLLGYNLATLQDATKEDS